MYNFTTMFDIRLAKDYLMYRLKAKTRHGLHSPFVYRLVDKVIYDFDDKKVYPEVENIRARLLNDDRMITITDLDEGSKVNNDRQKRIGDIAKKKETPSKVAQLLYRLAVDLHPENIIELGTSMGIIGIYLQKAAPKAKVYTLEACPATAKIALESFAKAGLNTIELITGNFDDTLPGVINSLDKLDLIFLNDNHPKKATLKYFEWCLPKVHDDTLLIFNGIYHSEDMKEAWTQIKAHPQVTATVDLFWIGLVYFRKGQVKEDFVIKI